MLVLGTLEFNSKRSVVIDLLALSHFTLSAFDCQRSISGYICRMRNIANNDIEEGNEKTRTHTVHKILSNVKTNKIVQID